MLINRRQLSRDLHARTNLLDVSPVPCKKTDLEKNLNRRAKRLCNVVKGFDLDFSKINLYG